MGVNWSGLPHDVRQLLEQEAAIRLPRMITQGVSNTLYGMAIMGAFWSDCSESYQKAVLSAVEFCFQPSKINAVVNAQAVANVLYALGISGADWSSLPAEVKISLMNGVSTCLPNFKSQEIANLIYG
jgi:hypothetical protein